MTSAHRTCLVSRVRPVQRTGAPPAATPRGTGWIPPDRIAARFLPPERERATSKASLPDLTFSKKASIASSVAAFDGWRLRHGSKWHQIRSRMAVVWGAITPRDIGGLGSCGAPIESRRPSEALCPAHAAHAARCALGSSGRRSPIDDRPSLSLCRQDQHAGPPRPPPFQRGCRLVSFARRSRVRRRGRKTVRGRLSGPARGDTR